MYNKDVGQNGITNRTTMDIYSRGHTLNGEVNPQTEIKRSATGQEVGKMESLLSKKCIIVPRHVLFCYCNFCVLIKPNKN